MAEAREILAAAAERAAAHDPETAAIMLAEAAHLSFFAGDAREMLRTAERADELSAGTGRTCADPRAASPGGWL